MFKICLSTKCPSEKCQFLSLTRARNPLDEGAVVEDRRFGQRLDVDEVESTPFVAEEQLLRRLVQLQPVDLRVMAHLKNVFLMAVKMQN